MGRQRPPPYQAITYQAKRDARKVAAILGVQPGAIVLGLLDLWEHCRDRKTPIVGALVVASCFGPDPRTAEALAEFGFLEVLGGGQVRVKGAEAWLQLSESRARGGRASTGNLRQFSTGSPPAQRRHVPDTCRTDAGQEPEHPAGTTPAPPNTQHLEKIPPTRARAGHGDDQTCPTAKDFRPVPQPVTPPLGEALDGQHRAIRRRPLEWGPTRDVVATQRAVADLGEPDEVVRRLRNALTVPKGAFPYFGDARDLVRHWSQYAEPYVPKAAGPPRARAAAADTDWSTTPESVTNPDGTQSWK